MSKKQLELKVYELELRLLIWSATFQKYESFKANGRHGKTIDQVIRDYYTCKDATFSSQKGGDVK